MTDIYPELRSDVAVILRSLGKPGAEILEETELIEGVEANLEADDLRGQVESLTYELEEARSDAVDLCILIGEWAKQLDDLDVDSEARDDLRPIIKRMRKTAK